ncbi:MAG: FAD-binding protein [Armatimonadetes bacterium]|nr:FAD-binding protein [Armatimonadota bacterium]
MAHAIEPMDVASDLAREVDGELHFDPVGRTLYASAACVYETMPLGAVVAKHADDVAAVIRYAAGHGLSIVPRGAATALAGQTVGPGIVVDVSRHLTATEDLDEEHVRVQPGVVLKGLQAHLAERGRFFPPDPSSGRAATLGGMIANNASGAHSVKYGTTKEYVRSLDVILADGSRTTLAPEPRPVRGNSLAGQVEALLEPAQGLLAEHWPRANKSSSGYDLPGAWTPERVDLTRLVSGSEGTLAFVVSADLRTLARPAARASALVCVAALADVGDVVNELLSFALSALEIVDRSFLNLLRGHEAAAMEAVPGDPDAVLLVELDGAEGGAVAEGLARVQQAFAGRTGINLVAATDPAEQKRLWALRDAANPILNRMPGQLKPITFVEDGAVEPARLPEYIRGLSAIMAKHQVEACVFGHAGSGHLHIKPVLNLRSSKDVAKMEAIASDACDLLVSLRGSIAGEHGDGLARTPLLRRMYGPVYPLFEAVKQLFDPQGVLNPGKVVTPDGARRVTDDLRLGRNARIVPTGSVFDEPEWRLEMDKCHGCGTCRDYCPVFLATGEEAATARAKANLLRALVRGDLPHTMLYDRSFKRVMDLCVNCQLCLTECPTKVDIPGLARRARAAYVKHRGQTLQNRILADSGRTSRLNAAVAPLANLALRSPLLRGAMEAMVGIDHRRAMPEFRRLPFITYRTKWWREAERRVLYFPGCYGLYNDPDGEAWATIEVLEANRVAVSVPSDLRCCGIAKITVGSEESARKDAAWNLRRLLPHLRDGIRVLASAASCGLALRRDYLELLGEEARPLARQVADIHEYLLELHAEGRLDLDFPPLGKVIAYHEPCHLKAQPSAAGSAAKLLDLLPGVTRVPIADTCCGIAGTFGMKSSKPPAAARARCRSTQAPGWRSRIRSRSSARATEGAQGARLRGCNEP